MSTDDVLKKVKKLFALGTSTNEYESALAIAQAQKLLDKYNLSMEQLDDIEIEKNKKVIEDIFMEKGSYTNWEKHLMLNIIPAFDCSFFIRSEYRKKSCIVVGTKTDVKFVKFVIPYLKDTLNKLGSKYTWAKHEENNPYWNKRISRQIKQSFCIGAIDKITQIVKEQRTKTSEITALIIRKKDLIKEHMNQYTKMNHTKFRSNVWDNEAYTCGSEAGKNINLNRHIEKK